MTTTHVFAKELEQLNRYAQQLSDAACALEEFAADHGPLGDPTLRHACLRALVAGEVATGAAVLAGQAAELIPDTTIEIEVE